jgi:hypothetical protein
MADNLHQLSNFGRAGSASVRRGFVLLDCLTRILAYGRRLLYLPREFFGG